MTIFQIMYSLYLHCLGFPFFCLLSIGGWKKRVLTINRSQILNAPQIGPLNSYAFRFRFYRNAALDFLRVLHRYLGHSIYSRRQDQSKLINLASGPALFLSAHFSNWELMGRWLIKTKGIPLLSMARPFKNQPSNRGLRILRLFLGIPILEKAIPRQALRHIHSGKAFGMLWDQYSHQGQDRALFFNHDVRMDPLPGFLTRHTSAPIFFGALLPGGQFRIIQLFHSPASRSKTIQASSSKSISPTAHSTPLSVDRLARRYHRVLEILVLNYPDHYYGLTHRRFKDQIFY
jgi:lauroyl/myristoyl acyltransferase